MVGHYCVLELDAAAKGPLFLTINDLPTGFGDNSGELTVDVTFTPRPPARPEPSEEAPGDVSADPGPGGEARGDDEETNATS